MLEEVLSHETGQPIASSKPTHTTTLVDWFLGKIGGVLNRRSVAVGGAFLMAVVLHAWWRTGSVFWVLPYIGGQRLFVESMQFKIDDQEASSGRALRTLRVKNCSGSNLHLLGAKKSCSCISLVEFPFLIPSLAEGHIPLSVGVPPSDKPIEMYVKFFTDDQRLSTFTIKIRGPVE